jgi:hypothetical protein
VRPLTAQDIFNLPDRQRRRFRFIPKRRGKYRKINRPKLSPEELVSYLRINGIHSSRQLERCRREGDPTLSDYRRAFAKWSDAIEQAFGRVEKVVVCNDPEYFAKLLVQFDIKTIARYRELRRLRPDIVPSYWEVRRKWGGFKGLKLLLRRYSLKAIFDSYLSLKRRLGRYPTRGECRDYGIAFSKLKELFGHKKKLDEFLDGLEKKK